MVKRKRSRARPAVVAAPAVVAVDDSESEAEPAYPELSPRSSLLAAAREEMENERPSKRWLATMARLEREVEKESNLDDDLPDEDCPTREGNGLVVQDSDDDLPELWNSESDCDADDDVSVSTDSSGRCSSDGDIDFDMINRLPEPGSSSDDEADLKPSTVRPPFVPVPVRDRTTPDIGLNPDEMHAFMAFGPPQVLLCILAMMNSLSCYAVRGLELDTMDFFSGKAQVTRHFRKRGLRSLEYDVVNNPKYQDLNGTWGFIHALQGLRRLTPHTAIVWLGTVCSTWIFMSRNSTMRTHLNPQGDTQRRCVRNGNRQAARSALIIAWCVARCMGFVLEQPASSLLWRHPSLVHVQQVARAMGARWHQIKTYMFHYEAGHMKKTELLSNESWTHMIANEHPGKASGSKSAPPTATVTVRSDGKKQCTGTDALKGTQEYTAAFGKAVASAAIEERSFFDDCQCKRGQFTTEHNSDDEEQDPWGDAELDGVAAALLRYHD